MSRLLRTALLILAIAATVRLLILATGAVSFHSDEAVVALMARHMLQGEFPTFFYGQAYMGSLDAALIAVGFALFGQSVLTIRLVQFALYLGVVASGMFAAYRLSGRERVMMVAGLVLALPPVLLAIYSSATLGGYNETLIFGNLLLGLGYDASHEHRRSAWRWALMGLIGGLAWWTNGLIVLYAAPVALLLLFRLFRPFPQADSPPSPGIRVGLVGLALVAFFVGSAPWWIFNVQHEWAALAFYIDSDGVTGFAGTEIAPLPIPDRLIGLFFLGIPALTGLRFPWQPAYFLAPLGVAALAVDALAVFRLARPRRTSDGGYPLKPDASGLLLAMFGLFVVIFLASKFSTDPTGRYFLPLLTVLAIALGALAASLPVRGTLAWAAPGLLALVLGYHTLGVVSAARVEPGLTTQFFLPSHIPHTHDQALIDFLDDHRLYHGYTQYWVSFRLAFLSGERMQYSAALPYKASLDYTPADERYPAYRVATDESENIAYIVANVEEVNDALRRAFAAQDITYETEVIGPYTVYYDFAPVIPRPPLNLTVE